MFMKYKDFLVNDDGRSSNKAPYGDASIFGGHTISIDSKGEIYLYITNGSAGVCEFILNIVGDDIKMHTSKGYKIGNINCEGLFNNKYDDLIISTLTDILVSDGRLDFDMEFMDSLWQNMLSDARNFFRSKLEDEIKFLTKKNVNSKFVSTEFAAMVNSDKFVEYSYARTSFNVLYNGIVYMFDSTQPLGSDRAIKIHNLGPDAPYNICMD